MVGETDFPAGGNHFFSPFFETPVSFFFRLVQIDFFKPNHMFL